MMFELEWKKGAIIQLNNLEKSISNRILKKVETLRENPLSKNIKRLKGEEAFRLRVGDYRVIFEVDFKNKLISILRLGHRRNIYKSS